MPNATAFPTTFPADAATEIGKAILGKQFTTALIEPIYDLAGYALFRIFGSSAPSPTAKLYGMRDLVQATRFAAPEHDDETVGNMLVAAGHASAHGKFAATYGVEGDPAKALPWKSILSVLFTILQGLLLSAEPPIANPADA